MPSQHSSCGREGNFHECLLGETEATPSKRRVCESLGGPSAGRKELTMKIGNERVMSFRVRSVRMSKWRFGELGAEREQIGLFVKVPLI